MTQRSKPSRAGIYPPDHSSLSRAASITNAPVPPLAVIPLLQHSGKPARCMVKPGQTVGEGMLIGQAEGPHSAHLHSSIPGRVVEIIESPLIGGGTCPAVVIELGGSFERSGRPQTALPWDSLGPQALLDLIRSAGVVGMGGEGVPTHLKLALSQSQKTELFVANGVDCEPSLTADYAVMRERPAQIVEGARICRKILGASRAVIAVGDSSEDLVPPLRIAIQDQGDPIELIVVPSHYPYGHEELLLASISGHGVSSENGSPPPIGSPRSIILNVATINAVFEAVVYRRPVIDRVLTVTGMAVRTPRNLKVRIGTPISDLLAECGGLVSEPAKVVLGGPMRGAAIESLQIPVTKGTFGVVAFSHAEARPRREWPCVHCGACVDACPWGLEPTRIYKLIERRRMEEAAEAGLSRCTECGCCAFACPSHIPLVAILRRGKALLGGTGGAGGTGNG